MNQPPPNPYQQPFMQQIPVAASAPTGFHPMAQHQQQQQPQHMFAQQPAQSMSFYPNPGLYTQEQIPQQLHQPQQQQPQQLPQQPQSQPQHPFPHMVGAVAPHAGMGGAMMMSPASLPHHAAAVAANMPHHPGFPQQTFSHSGGGPAMLGQVTMAQSPHNGNHNGAFSQQPAMAVATARPMFTTPTRPAQQPNQIQTQTPTPSQLQASPSPHTPQTTQAVQPSLPIQNAQNSQAIAAREKARVTILLEINSALLQEVVSLQEAGKTGVVNQTIVQSPQETPVINSPTEPQVTKPGSKPVQEYVDCMRRLQANLAYLATIADRAKKTGMAAPSAPAVMTPPPNLPGLSAAYAQLNELFPESAKHALQIPAQPRQMPAQTMAHLMPQALQAMQQPMQTMPFPEGMMPAGAGGMTG